MVCSATNHNVKEAVGGNPGSRPCCAATPTAFSFADTDPMNNIKYVQLEPAAFLTDIEFQLMDSEQRGVYCSIIFYLYCNGGSIELDHGSAITLLQGQTTILAQISGCRKVGAEWDAVWGKIAKKFKITGNVLTHRRVTEELRRAENYRKSKSAAGKKGMAARWGDNTDITKESKVKKSEEKYSPTSDEFVLSELLLKLILERKPDYKKPNLQTWAKHVDLMIRLDNRTPARIREVTQWCQADDFWMNNILSTEKLRKQFDKLELRMVGNNGKSTKNRRDYENQKSDIGTAIDV